jgi:RNA exonuclease 1
MGRNKKRKHAQYAQDLFPEGGVSTIGVGATLAHLQSPELPFQGASFASPSQKHDRVENGQGSDPEEWTYVGKGGKRQKKDHQTMNEGKQGKSKGNYPGLTFAELHKLQYGIKISDLQNLALYCLADGTSPQWVAVRHHNNVKRAVVLFVPGLEKGMFKGNIALEESISMAEDVETPAEIYNNNDESAKDSSDSIVTSITKNLEDSGFKRVATSPDEYLPTRLEPEKLAPPLKPLADVFTHLWPVKAPGDDKYFKVHSPLHAMLTSHITKSQEEKRAEKETKGPRPAKEGKHWEDKRTPITAFIASQEELQENEYLLHPVYFKSHQDKLFEELRRHDAKQTEQSGWVDTMVNKLGDGDVPDKDIEKGSLTAGRSVLAMDCEMCKVDGGELALTRISIVDWDGSVVLDELVKPEKAVIDYLTP